MRNMRHHFDRFHNYLIDMHRGDRSTKHSRENDEHIRRPPILPNYLIKYRARKNIDIREKVRFQVVYLTYHKRHLRLLCLPSCTEKEQKLICWHIVARVYVFAGVFVKQPSQPIKKAFS